MALVIGPFLGRIASGIVALVLSLLSQLSGAAMRVSVRTSERENIESESESEIDENTNLFSKIGITLF